MDALRQKAGTVNWDDDSDAEEEEEDASPSRAAPVSKRAAAPAQAVLSKRGAPAAPPSRRAPPPSDDEDEEEDEQASTEEEDEDEDDGSVSEMSDTVAGTAPAGRPDTPSERTTSSDTDDEDDDEDDEDERAAGKRGGAQQQASTFSRTAPGREGAAFSRAGSARSQPEREKAARGRGGDGDAAIDWTLVERQLAAVPPAFKQATFDPVPHVVEILNAAQPDAELDKLQDLQVSIDGLVTDVVAAYSTGFSRALQNYSQVLALFTAGSTHVTRATRSLDEAGTHLSSRKPALQAQWLRAATAAAVCRTLDNIAQCASYDDRIAACLRDNRPVDAVSALMETAAALEREEMRSVPGLRSLRTGLALRRGTLFDDLLARLLARIYDTGAALGGANDDAILSGGGGAKGGDSDRAQQQPQQQANPLAGASAGRPAAPASTPGKPAAPPVAAPQADGSFAGLQSGLAQYRAAAAVALSGEAGGQAAGGVSSVSATTTSGSGASVEELVDAMLRLSTGPGGGGNGSSAVRDALTQKHGDQVRVLIAAHMARAVPRSSRGGGRGGPQAPTALAQALAIIPPGGVPSQALLLAVADSPAVEALDAVCAALLSSVRQYMRAQRRVVESPVAWQDVKGPLTGTPPSMAYKQEAVRSWGLVQSEVERLLAAMLAPPQTLAADAPGGGGGRPAAAAPLLRGTAAVAARKAEEQAVLNAKAMAAQAAGAQAVAQAGVFTFGLGDLLGDALVQAAPPTPGAKTAAAALSAPGVSAVSQPGQPDAGTGAVGALLDGGYAAAAALLPGCGVHLAPFATAPVTRLNEAVATEFPECTGAGSDDALMLPPDAAAAQLQGGGGKGGAAPAKSGRSLRLGKSSSRRSRRTGGVQPQEAQPQ